MPFAGLFARLRSSYTHIRLALLVTLLFTVLVATIFRTPSIIFMAALLFAAPLMGILAGGFLSRGLDVTRALPDTGSVGDIVSGRLSISNRSPWPAFLIHLRPHGTIESDGSNAGYEYSYGTPTHTEQPGVTGGRLQKANKGASKDSATKDSATHVPAPLVLLGSPETIVPLLRAGERLEWTPQWRLQRRGVHRLLPARAGANDPLGLFSVLKAQTGANEITVLPRPLPIERLSFLGGAQANPRTPQHAAIVAEALDFHGVRAWRPGEAIRRVHWKSTARTGTLHVVEWEESLGRDLTLLLDARSFSALTTASQTSNRDDAASRKKPRGRNGASTRGSSVPGSVHGEAIYDEAFEAAITLVASIAAHLLEGGHRFQLFCWQSAIEAAPTASLASSNLFTRRGASRDNAAAEKPEPGNANRDFKSQTPTSPSQTDAPVLCRHLARGSGDVGDTLRMLARLDPLPDVAATDTCDTGSSGRSGRAAAGAR
jgi:uncharacterized protein (DUF58 family)